MKMSSGESDLLHDIVTASSKGDRLQLLPTFRAYASNEYFKNNIWQKMPFLCKEPLPNVAGAFTMQDLKEIVDTEFLEAGRGTFNEGRGGWNMAAVSKPRGTSFQDAKLQFQDVLNSLALKSGTVVFNSAGGFMPSMAIVCLECLEAFQLPTALNMYITAAGQKVSAPPHTDKQDVFVIQTQGQKRWRVFAPPPPAIMFRADPFARGKGTDSLELTELQAPILDTVLSPGQILYVPAGFPHTTDTTEGISNTVDESVHLTVGIDTHIWALNYASLREICYRRAGVTDKHMITKLASENYWDLQSTIPLGFLSTAETTNEYIIKSLIEKLRKIEEVKWKDLSDKDVAKKLNIDECVNRLLVHHTQMTNLFRLMYSDVGYKISETKVDISFLRSKPYFEALDATMCAVFEWSEGPGSGFKSSSSTKKSSSGKKR